MRIAVIALAMLIAAACDAEAPTTVELPLIVEPGLTPHLSAGQVVAIVQVQDRHAIQLAGAAARPLRIVKMTVTTAGRVNAVEPGAGQGDVGLERIVWVVRAEGTFATNRTLRPRPIAAASGFYVIDDSDGSIAGYGFP